MTNVLRTQGPKIAAIVLGAMVAYLVIAGVSPAAAIVAVGVVGPASTIPIGTSRGLADRVNLRRLRWIAILLPGLTILAVDLVLYLFHEAKPLPHGAEHFAFGAVLFLGSIPFAAFVFAMFSRIQREVVSHREQIAIMEERERIAREMHDNFGQVLGYVNTKAQATLLMCDEQRYSDAHVQIRQLESATRDAYSEVREAIMGLRSTSLLRQGLMPALEEYGGRFGEQAGISVSFLSRLPKRVSAAPEVEIQIFRILQEALSNVRKHAGATAASIQVAPVPGGVEFVVTDDGCGFDEETRTADNTNGFGLQTMRERADIIGAQLAIQSEEAKGTRVSLRVPSTLIRSRL